MSTQITTQASLKPCNEEVYFTHLQVEQYINTQRRIRTPPMRTYAMPYRNGEFQNKANLYDLLKTSLTIETKEGKTTYTRIRQLQCRRTPSNRKELAVRRIYERNNNNNIDNTIHNNNPQLATFLKVVSSWKKLYSLSLCLSPFPNSMFALRRRICDLERIHCVGG